MYLMWKELVFHMGFEMLVAVKFTALIWVCSLKSRYFNATLSDTYQFKIRSDQSQINMKYYYFRCESNYATKCINISQIICDFSMICNVAFWFQI